MTAPNISTTAALPRRFAGLDGKESGRERFERAMIKSQWVGSEGRFGGSSDIIFRQQPGGNQHTGFRKLCGFPETCRRAVLNVPRADLHTELKSNQLIHTSTRFPRGIRFESGTRRICQIGPKVRGINRTRTNLPDDIAERANPVKLNGFRE